MNRLRTVGFSASFALFFAAASHAAAAIDPVLLKLAPPDAKILSGVQVQQALGSPFGQYILSQMQPNDPGFLQFIAQTGFDPRRDLQQILGATSASSTDGAKGNGLILGRGTFQPSQIIAAATSGGAKVTQYKGVSLITNGDSQSAVAFLDSTTAAIGDIASVEGVIDRQISGAAFSGSLAQKAQSVSSNSQAWFATVTPLSDFLNGKIPNGNLGNMSQNNLFQSVLESSGGVAFTSNSVIVTADAVTASAQNAQSLIDVLKFLASMVQTNANDPKLGTLASNATFTVNGTTAHLSISLSEQQAEQLFTPQLKKSKPVPAPVPAQVVK